MKKNLSWKNVSSKSPFWTFCKMRIVIPTSLSKFNLFLVRMSKSFSIFYQNFLVGRSFSISYVLAFYSTETNPKVNCLKVMFDLINFTLRLLIKPFSIMSEKIQFNSVAYTKKTKKTELLLIIHSF